MGRLLGLGITDYPYLSQSDKVMSLSFQQALKSPNISPDAKNPATWPAEMRRQWEADEGEQAARDARSAQSAQLSMIQQALQTFGPDYVLVISKDHGETLGTSCVPQYWFQAHEEVTVRPYGIVNDPDNFFREDPNKTVTVRGHRNAAFGLVNGLNEHGFDPAYSLDSRHPNGLGHTVVGALVHLDWAKREFEVPLVPLAIDPFGPRERAVDGMSPMRASDPKPLTAERAFNLGAALAQTILTQPYDVAVVAAAGWSHANNTSRERSWLYPDIDADLVLYEQLKENRFENWRRMTHAQMEKAGQWELLCWIVLAGAMHHAGAHVTHTDFQGNWLFNSNWVNAIFEAVELNRYAPLAESAFRGVS